ncbi:TetR family transcriptional regulator [Streptomyces camponoticapitis]|uniref:TetR family transcriptional regulator n=1 Tax=Streptomyces camponoticapitis TaxID=1616125 RepID=A0ABQ2EWR8_9ACTN|nr:TetR/AcrR family transcriptional regulator [Streptomyces camponoticapitis]GGK24525.1 TetR family transcriptional regulator [Streptomyces camponoticapitis]
MSRVSQAQARENRERVVAAASRIFREQGVHTSIADLMESVGLTRGGFPKQFGSKDALVAEATEKGFSGMSQLLDSFDDTHGDRTAARQALVDFYLSAEHRDEPGTGCPTAGFAGDMARRPTPDEPRAAYSEGARHFADWLSNGDDRDGLADMCTLVGAILLARATAGTELSEEILDAAHRAQTPPVK